ncbi:uncharacterized protein LOC119210897 isoform X1 [Pungitius pungitius]|uniref:uncharacterized protein LOC119210897 isoform X1 n=1 Tax=Pungitius pungitius TaxID=134920 RepID=UPI002E10363D
MARCRSYLRGLSICVTVLLLVSGVVMIGVGVSSIEGNTPVAQLFEQLSSSDGLMVLKVFGLVTVVLSVLGVCATSLHHKPLLLLFSALIFVEFVALMVVASPLVQVQAQVTPPSFEVTPPSFVVTPPSFEVTPPSFVVTPPSFEVTPPSFVVTPPSFEVTPPSFVVTPPSFEVTPPSFVVTPPSFVVTLPSFVVTPPSFVVTPPSFVVTPPLFVVTPPSFEVTPPLLCNWFLGDTAAPWRTVWAFIQPHFLDECPQLSENLNFLLVRNQSGLMIRHFAVVAVVVVVVVALQMDGAVDEVFRNVTPLHRAEPYIQSELNKLQASDSCCGLRTFKDWEKQLPVSCFCKPAVSTLQPSSQSGNASSGGPCVLVGSDLYPPTSQVSERLWVHSEPCGPILKSHLSFPIKVRIGIISAFSTIAMAAVALCLALGLQEYWTTPPVETTVDDFDRVKYQPKPSLT